MKEPVRWQRRWATAVSSEPRENRAQRRAGGGSEQRQSGLWRRRTWTAMPRSALTFPASSPIWSSFSCSM